MTFVFAPTDFLRQLIGLQPKPQQMQTSSQSPSQTPTVIKQPFPEYHTGTQELTFDLFTEEPKVPPIILPSLSKAKTPTQKTVASKMTSSKAILPKTKSGQTKSETISTEKKPLTTETIEQIIGTQSSIPLLPYTPEGLLEALKQRGINPAQLQQILGVLAPQNLSVDNLLATVIKKIDKLPEDVKADLKKVEDKMEKIGRDIEKNLKQQFEINNKYADQELDLLKKHLNLVKQVFSDLMKEKPNLEPDKWTTFGRQLAMALGAISALAHPGYAHYFYMAIPQVVQYWNNEDAENFEKAIKKFELALSLAGTQLDFYNQIMEQSLTVLEKQKEKELLPVILTGQLLMEKYHFLVDLYNKIAPEIYKMQSDRIGNLLAVADLTEKHRHNKILEDLQKFAKEIMLERLKFDKWYKTQTLAIRNYLAKIAGERLQLTIDLLVNPQKYIGKFIPNLLSRAQDLTEALKFLKASNFPVEGILSELMQDETF
jgi:hypothetical protein